LFKFFLHRFARRMIAAFALAASAGVAGTASADTPTSAAISTLYSFSTSDTSSQSGSPLIGYSPHSLTAGPNRVFYALTQSGGAGGAGTVLSFNAGSAVSTVLYAFSGGTGPDDSVMAGADGTLYGTLALGGVPASGAVYSLAADGSRYTALHEFTASDDSGINTDGSYPVGPLLQRAGGKLYGETLLGGPSGAGVVYAINPDGSGLAVLHSFGSGTDGAYPAGGLVAGPDGTLYGVTEYGGTGSDGTVFKIAPDGSGYAALYQFSADDDRNVNSDGAVPTAGLTLGSDGLLYGVASVGGGSGSGVIFQLGTDGSGFNALYAFSSPDSQGANGDGASPSATLVKDAAGNLFGTTASGGSAGQGTLFSLSANATVLSFLYSFGSGDGYGPVLAASGSELIGTTGSGGANALGSVFSVGLNYPATHVLWSNTDGRAMLWRIAEGGAVTLHGFGPYIDKGPQDKWTATALATGPDGLNHLLWNNTDGRVMLWTVDDAGSFTLAGFGPYIDKGPQDKWSATAVSVGPDNMVHLLWNNTDGRVMLWNVDSSFHFTYAGFGPYIDKGPQDHWRATALATGPDGLTRIVWNNTDHRVMLWNVDSAFHFTYAGYGPYVDNAPDALWSAVGVSVGPDNVTHLLWSNTDRRAMFWNVDSAYGFTVAGGYGPYIDNAPGDLWSAVGLATGPDYLHHLLWANTDNRAMLWGLDDAGSFSVTGYGPYTDDAPGNLWSAIAISTGP